MIALPQSGQQKRTEPARMFAHHPECIASACRDDRQEYLRRVRCVVMNRVVSGYHPAMVTQWLAGVGVYVEPRIVAARAVDPNAMSFLEYVRIRIERNCDLRDFTGLERRCLVVKALSI